MADPRTEEPEDNYEEEDAVAGDLENDKDTKEDEDMGEDFKKFQAQMSQATETVQKLQQHAPKAFQFLVVLSYLGDPVDRFSSIGSHGVPTDYDRRKPAIRVTSSIFENLNDSLHETLEVSESTTALASEGLIEKAEGNLLLRQPPQTTPILVIPSHVHSAVVLCTPTAGFPDVAKLAQDVSRDALKLATAAKDTAEGDLISAHERMGDVCLLCHEPNTAIKHFQQASSLLERVKMEQASALSLRVLDKLAWAAEVAGDDKSALKYFQQLLELKQAIYKDRPHLTIALTLNEIAHIYNQMGNFKKSLEFQQQALGVVQQAVKPTPADVRIIAAATRAVGTAHRLLGNLVDAKKFTREAVKLLKSRRKDRSGNAERAHAYAALGEVNLDLFNTDEALKHFQRVLNAFKQIHRMNIEHIDIVHALFWLGNTYYERDDYKAAKSSLLKSYKLAKKLTPLPTRDIGPVLVSLGGTYLAMEDVKKAVKHMADAKKMLDKHVPSKLSLDYARLNHFLGLAKANQNLVNDARKFFDEAKATVEKLAGAVPTDEFPHPLLVRLFRTYSDVFASTESLDEAARFANKSLMMLLKYGELSPPIVRARAFEHVADYCAKIGTSMEEQAEGGVPSTLATTMTSKAILYYSQAVSLLAPSKVTPGPPTGPVEESPIVEIDFTGDESVSNQQDGDINPEAAAIEAKLKYLQETTQSPAIGKQEDECVIS